MRKRVSQWMIGGATKTNGNEHRRNAMSNNTWLRFNAEIPNIAEKDQFQHWAAAHNALAQKLFRSRQSFRSADSFIPQEKNNYMWNRGWVPRQLPRRGHQKPTTVQIYPMSPWHRKASSILVTQWRKDMTRFHTVIDFPGLGCIFETEQK